MERSEETPQKDMDIASDTVLPLPAMHSLLDIRKALAFPMLPPMKRAARVKFIVEHDAQFLKELIRVADQCRDLDDDESLELLFQITKSLFELCDVEILHLLLSDEFFLDVVGLLEFNPHTIKKMSFREELTSQMKFKEIISINDPLVVKAIHSNFRIDAIKDNMLSRTLADGCSIWLDSLMNENNISILTYISNHEEYMVMLRKLIADPSTETNGLMLLQNIMRLIQITQPPSRGVHCRVPHMLKPDYSGMNPVFGSLHHALFPTTLLPSFASILTQPNDRNRLLVLEMLHHLVLFQNGDLLRVYMADERCDLNSPFTLEWKEGQSLLLSILVCFYQAESCRSSILDILKHLFLVVPGRDDKFLYMLYQGNYMQWWIHLLSLPDQTGMLYELHATVWEVLTMCIAHHGYRIKYLLAKTPVAEYCTNAFQSRNKLRILHATNFLKACVLRNESFYSTLVATPSIWDAVFEILRVPSKNPSAVVSAILEMIMKAEIQNCRLIMEHIVSHSQLPLLESRFPGVVKSLKMRLADQAPVDSSVESNVTAQEEERYWAQEEQATMVVVDEVDEDDVGLPPPLIPLEDREETGIVTPTSTSTRKTKKVKDMFSSIQWSSPSKKQKMGDVLAQFVATPLKMKVTEQTKPSQWHCTGKFTPSKRPRDQESVILNDQTPQKSTMDRNVSELNLKQQTPKYVRRSSIPVLNRTSNIPHSAKKARYDPGDSISCNDPGKIPTLEKKSDTGVTLYTNTTKTLTKDPTNSISNQEIKTAKLKMPLENVSKPLNNSEKSLLARTNATRFHQSLQKNKIVGRCINNPSNPATTPAIQRSQRIRRLVPSKPSSISKPLTKIPFTSHGRTIERNPTTSIKSRIPTPSKSIPRYNNSLISIAEPVVKSPQVPLVADEVLPASGSTSKGENIEEPTPEQSTTPSKSIPRVNSPSIPIAEPVVKSPQVPMVPEEKLPTSGSKSKGGNVEEPTPELSSMASDTGPVKSPFIEYKRDITLLWQKKQPANASTPRPSRIPRALKCLSSTIKNELRSETKPKCQTTIPLRRTRSQTLNESIDTPKVETTGAASKLAMPTRTKRQLKSASTLKCSIKATSIPPQERTTRSSKPTASMKSVPPPQSSSCKTATTFPSSISKSDASSDAPIQLLGKKEDSEAQVAQENNSQVNEILTVDRGVDDVTEPGVLTQLPSEGVSCCEGFAKELKATKSKSGELFCLCWSHLDPVKYAWQPLFLALAECEVLTLNPHEADIPTPSKVKFQCYDLSVVELQYISERGTTQRIENLLYNCDSIVRRLNKTDNSNLNDIDRALTKVSEISIPMRKIASYYKTVFQAHSTILVDHISLLSASLARHYLRVIFLYFDERLSDEKSSCTTVHLPPQYIHQDLGAAIHRALDDRFLYSSSRSTAREQYLYSHSVDFLLKAFQVVQTTTKDPYLSSLIRKLQQLCSRLVFFSCDDEAHFYPLASISTFVTTLSNELAAIDMDKVDQEYAIPMSPVKSIALPEQESTPLKLKYRASTCCFECRKAWSDRRETVECAICHNRYHLMCLFLSPTFRNLSGTYKCPRCL